MALQRGSTLSSAGAKLVVVGPKRRPKLDAPLTWPRQVSDFCRGKQIYDDCRVYVDGASMPGRAEAGQAGASKHDQSHLTLMPFDLAKVVCFCAICSRRAARPTNDKHDAHCGGSPGNTTATTTTTIITQTIPAPPAEADMRIGRDLPAVSLRQPPGAVYPNIDSHNNRTARRCFSPLWLWLALHWWLQW